VVKEDSTMTSLEVPAIDQDQDWPPVLTSRHQFDDVEPALQGTYKEVMQLPTTTTTVEISPRSDVENCNNNSSNVLEPISSGGLGLRQRRLSVDFYHRLEPDELTVDRRLSSRQQSELLPVCRSTVECSATSTSFQPSFCSLPNLQYESDNTRTPLSGSVSRILIMTSTEDNQHIGNYCEAVCEVSGVKPSQTDEGVDNCSHSEHVSITHSDPAVDDVNPDIETASVTNRRHRSHSVGHGWGEYYHECDRRSSVGNHVVSILLKYRAQVCSASTSSSSSPQIVTS